MDEAKMMAMTDAARISSAFPDMTIYVMAKPGEGTYAACNSATHFELMKKDWIVALSYQGGRKCTKTEEK